MEFFRKITIKKFTKQSHCFCYQFIYFLISFRGLQRSSRKVSRRIRHWYRRRLIDIGQPNFNSRGDQQWKDPGVYKSRQSATSGTARQWSLPILPLATTSSHWTYTRGQNWRGTTVCTEQNCRSRWDKSRGVEWAWEDFGIAGIWETTKQSIRRPSRTNPSSKNRQRTQCSDLENRTQAEPKSAHSEYFEAHSLHGGSTRQEINKCRFVWNGIII